MPTQLQLSIVMPSLHRADVVPRTLSYLAAQRIDPATFEVILIEDGNHEAYREMFEAVRGEMPFAMSFMQNDGHRGPGLTQNRGIRAARAPLVLLLADDIFLDPDGLAAHLDVHRRNPQPEVAVLGRALQSPELDDTAFLRHWDPWGFSAMPEPKELPWYMFWACNLSFKREFVLAHGGFREHRGRGGGAAHEDVELGYRLQPHGLRVLYEPAAWGYHYHRYTLEQAVRRYYERGLNWGQFREFVPAPELLVHNHVLTAGTLREYLAVVRGEGQSAAWHLLRQAAFLIALNRVSEPLLWRPMLALAERSEALARLMHRQVYRAYLYYHFMRGVRHGRDRFQGSPDGPQPSAAGRD